MNNKTIFQFSVYWKDRAQTENVDKKSIQFKSALRGSLNPRLIKVLLSKVEAGSECTFLVWTVWQPDGTDSLPGYCLDTENFVWGENLRKLSRLLAGSEASWMKSVLVDLSWSWWFSKTCMSEWNFLHSYWILHKTFLNKNCLLDFYLQRTINNFAWPFTLKVFLPK